MKVHTVVQIEYDDGSMSRPFSSTQVYEKPPKLSLVCRVGTGITYSSTEIIQAHADSTIRFSWSLEDESGFLNKTDQLDLCFEQEPGLLKHLWTKEGVVAFQTPGQANLTGVITFMLVDKFGAASNKVSFTIRIVSAG